MIPHREMARYFDGQDRLPKSDAQGFLYLTPNKIESMVSEKKKKNESMVDPRFRTIFKSFSR